MVGGADDPHAVETRSVAREPSAAGGRVGVAAVTGASGYLGSSICAYLRSLGWSVVKLVRSAATRASTASGAELSGDEPIPRFFDLDQPVAAGTLDGVDLLVHAAYDLTLTSEADIWLTNVEGTRSLLDAAVEAGVNRIVVLSSMSAYQGTTQIYGRAKLAIEEITAEQGGCSVRPGLVYGDRPGGMAGALRRLARLPVVPLPTGEPRQFPVHERDFLDAIAAIVEQDPLPPGPIGIASPNSISFERLIVGLGNTVGHRIRFIPVPWTALYAGMRAAEALHLRLPIRSDSLLGLVRPAPTVPGTEVLEALGVTFRPFPE